MKIVYLIHSLHTAGGMEKILTSKANWLCDSADTEVWIVTSHLRGRKPFFPLDKRVHLIDAGVNDRVFGIRYRRRLQKFIDEIRPDVTISLCGSDVFQLLKCSGTGAKIAEYHFLHDKFFRKYPKFRIYAGTRTNRLNAALEKYDALVVLSNYDLEYFRHIFSQPEKVHKIGNTLSKIPETISELNDKRFICVGRLSPEKNFSEALKIWKLVSEKHQDWHLDIYGDGKERESLGTLIHQAGLDGFVSLKGNCPGIMDEYVKSSGLLVTSRYEGFGLVVLEAAACGVPSVAYACPGGLTELISDGRDGFIVSEGDANAAAEKITRIIEDKELLRELGRNAAVKASGYFPESIMKQWSELFDSLIGKQ